jgi:hypothetical protein
MGLQLGISDPYYDNAEAVGPGDIPVPHPAHLADATVHNDTQYVSHDIYNVTQIMPGPGGPPCWALLNYAGGNSIVNFLGQNSGPGLPPGLYYPELPVVTIIDYAVAVSPTAGATLEGNVTFVGRATPAQWVEEFVVRFFDNSTKNETLWSSINATTNNTGFFNITGLTPGTYDVSIDSRTSVSEMVTNVTLNSTAVVDFGTIRVGDANQDDSVSSKDKAKLYKGWGTSEGTPGWNADADFNNDGSLGSKDKALLYKFWGQNGDLVGY